VRVGVNDTGVDQNHPDLIGRVIPIPPEAGIDVDGHGTHVAGTIASSGASSPNAPPPGSTNGASFRGIANAAVIIAQPIDILTGPLKPDTELQATTATNGALISNNSWGYIGAYDYTFAAASWDAAVRDSIPSQPGSQPVSYVFSAGNDGFGGDDGSGGFENSITAPATGKNVITVGAIEQFRNITNELVINGETNMPFFGMTDSDDDVASFSSRGNVAPGVEGVSGRFKPDVVAPGVFVVSSRASGWTSNLNITANAAFLTEEVVPVGETNYYFFFGNPNAIEARIRVTPNGRSPVPFPTNTLYIRRGDLPPPSDLVVLSNSVNFPITDGIYYVGVGNNYNQDVYFDIQVVVVSERPFTPADQELINLNSGLGNLRYESGTSMAAPVVSGMLALIQQKLRLTPNPALMKALLINGARSIGQYDLQVDKARNHQGWGLVNFTNTIPLHSPDGNPPEWPVQFTTGTGLVTGQSETRTVSLSTNVPELRITLVWTDPPGNPSVSTKLVNDLDLVVENLSSGEIYVGNVISGDFSSTVDGSNVVSAVDVVNNVENVFIPNPRGGTNFSVTVKARRVNVNAVTAHAPTGVAQDYALVISCGNPEVPATFSVSAPTSVPDPTYEVTTLTNSVATFRSTAGGNPPFWTPPNSNGVPSQWQFFVFENTNAAVNTNVAFFTFLTPNLARPRASEEADIDLYVSTNPALTNFDANAIATANYSRKRGGTEAVVFTNASSARYYYIGVKSEDQQAAQFGLFGFAGDTPFSSKDSNGVVTVNGLALPVDIPDGSSEEASGVMVFAYCLEEIEMRNVVVTNTLTHDNGGDLFGQLEHDGAKAILNNHRGFEGTVTFIYDDSGSGQIVNSTPSDGPDRLRNFWGMQGQGAWQLLMVDDALSATGRVEALTLRLEPRQETNSDGFATALILPGGWFYTFVDVPPDAIGLTIDVRTDLGPVEVFVGRNYVPDDVFYDHTAVIAPPGGALVITPSDNPPLSGGVYFIGFHNPNVDALLVGYRIRVQRGLTGSLTNIYNPVGVLPLLDDAVTTSLLTVTNAREIVDVRVGVRIDHRRASDLVLTLVSPAGTRVVLAENRGGNSTAGYGAGGNRPYLHTIFTDNTNLTITPIKFGSPPFTNSPGPTNLQTTIVPGTAVLSSGFEDPSLCNSQVPVGFTVDGWFVGGGSVDVWCNGANGIAHSGNGWLELNGDLPGWISRIGNVPTIAGRQYVLTYAYSKNPAVASAEADIFINSISNSTIRYSSPNSTTNLGWQIGSALFTATGPSTRLVFESRTTNAFGIYLDTIQIASISVRTNGRNYFLPEEPLREVRGENAYGIWRLEILDNRALNPVQGVLLDWELDFDFSAPNPPTTTITNGQCYTNTIEGSAVRYFRVNVPVNATRATNTFFSTNSLNMSADRDTLPTGSFPPDDYPAVIGPNGQLIMSIAGSPPLEPGLSYYVALRNVDPRQTNTFAFCVDFDASPTNNLGNVVPLTNNACLTRSIEGTNLISYYSFDASSNAVGLFFDLRNLSGNVDMFVRRGLPLPIRGNSIESRNPGTTEEHIAVGAGQIPGRWYIGILNNQTNSVNYTLCVSEFTNYFRLTNDVCSSNTFTGFGQTHHFRFTITPGAEIAEFSVDASGDVDLYVRRTPPASEFVYDYASEGFGVSNEMIVIDRGSQPVPLLSGNWHAAVVSREVGLVNYCMKFTQVDPDSIRLYITNGFEMSPRYMDLAWTAPGYLQFHLEYSDSLAPANWQPFLDGNNVPIVFTPVGGTGNSFYFRDTSLFSHTTGLVTMRFYRLRILP
jgi:subtilisin-like proprotein convertase family protein